MCRREYPGQGLSLSHLIFALNEELKRTVYSPSITFDQVSQFDRDATAALSTIREWKNKLAPTHLPFDILSLIPAYLSHNDRLRASFVCRHWRGTLLQCGQPWSELFLSKHCGEEYAETFLKRAKASALEISALCRDWNSFDVWKLLSPHTKRIESLEFVSIEIQAIQEIAEIMPGNLQSLHTLTIKDFLPDIESRSEFPLLFSGAVNLKAFNFYSKYSKWSPSLRYFAFPSLVSFTFKAMPVREKFCILQLLDFLEASPKLETVHMEIHAEGSSEDIPHDRVVLLPNVKTFTLIFGDVGSAGRIGYEIGIHLLCPSARSTSFVHIGDPGLNIPPQQIFPDPVSWGPIVSQYTELPVEEVTLEIKPFAPFKGSLVFRSSDASTIELYHKAGEEDEDEFLKSREDNEDQLVFGGPSRELHEEVFAQAVWTIRNHPQVENIKRLRICHSSHACSFVRESCIADEVRILFGSLGSLDQLHIYDCSLVPYFYLTNPMDEKEGPMVFPPIKELVISDPLLWTDEQGLAIVELAKSHYELGRPFESMIISWGAPVSAWLEESLKPWVDRVVIRQIWSIGP